MCRAVLAEGLEVHLATTNVGLTVKGATRHEIVDYQGVPTIFFESPWGRSFKFSRTMAAWLDENVKRFDVVHIHAIFNHACMAATRACQKHHVPYVIRPLGTLDPWSLRQKRLRKQIFWQVQGERMLRQAAAVHYTTPGELSAAEESLHLSNGTVIPLGVDLGMAQAPLNGPPPSMLRGLSDAPFVLALSRIHPKKALDVLIDAFLDSSTNETAQEWRLVIAGDGAADYMNLLRRQVDEAAANHLVLFPGWVDGEAKWHLLRHASLLALPSHQENFGICALEALACGVPVIVSPHVNLADEIRNANAGWVCPVDRLALSSTLQEAFASEQCRIQKGDAGKRFAAEFTWPRVGHELRRLYNEITFPKAFLDQVVA